MNDTGTSASISAVAVPTKKFADHSINGVWGYTYFVEVDGLIKIGHSGAPKQRLSAFGRNKKVLAIVPNTIIGEGDAHRKFSHLRERGELFRIAPDLLAFIDLVKAEAEAMPAKERPVPTNEYDKIRSVLKKKALSEPAATLKRRAYYNLLEMTENFKKAPATAIERRRRLKFNIERELTRLASLS